MREELANVLNEYFYDYDTYEYKDCFNSKEEGYKYFDGLLEDKDGINATLNSLNENITNDLENDDDASMERINITLSMITKVKEYYKKIKSNEMEI